MPRPDKRKQSLYFPADMLADMHAQAERLDRSLSWVMQHVWRHSRDLILEMPSHQRVPPRPKPIELPEPKKDPPPTEPTQSDLDSEF